MSAVPVDSVGGLPGSIHSLVVVVQLPARLANNLCGSPGVASFFHSSIIACGSIGLFCFLSLAMRGDAVTSSTRHATATVLQCIQRIMTSFIDSVVMPTIPKEKTYFL